MGLILTLFFDYQGVNIANMETIQLIFIIASIVVYLAGFLHEAYTSLKELKRFLRFLFLSKVKP